MVALSRTRLYRGLPARVLVGASLLPLSGCQMLRTDQYLLVWFFVPLLTSLGAGGLFVVSRRSTQLEGWDLQREAADPGVAGILAKVFWTAVGAFAVFAVYNLYLQGMDWTLKLMNIGLWLLGSLIGVYLASFLGLRMAERRLPRDRGPRVALRRRRS